jgi:hypothetical protein
MGMLVRVGLGLLALINAWWGGWARFAPRHFFDTFPGFGHQWTAAYPPYNEHLVTDLGSTFLTLAFLLGAAAVLDQRAVRWVVLAGVIVFNALHLEFHALHAGLLSGLDLGASLTALALGVVGPLALLVLDVVGVRRRRTRSPRDQPS